MIIRVRKDAGRIIAMRLAEHFVRQGLKVFIENNKGKFSLAVFNSEDEELDYFSVDGLVGIETTKNGNQYFISNKTKFVPAEECFAGFL